MADFKILYLGAADIYEKLNYPDATKLVYISNADELQKEIIDAYAIVDGSMKYKIMDDTIKTALNLKMISTATTGSDHIELREINKRNIIVRTLKEDKELLQNITPAAELSWALLLSCARKLPSAFDHVKNGKWSRECFPGILIRGKQLGLIGCGRIGSWMGKYGNAFGMKVVGYDPYIDKFPSHIEKVELEKLLSTSDFISLHIHLTEENTNFLSRERLLIIKENAVIINTSRGGLIDEAALLECLQNKRINAAGLDVLATEPVINDHPLVNYARKHDNLIITPHCGGFSPDTVLIVTQHALNKIITYLGQ